MREIKFRAKEMGTHWVYGDLVRDGNFDSTLIRCKNGVYASNCGLYNGRSIYRFI